MTTSRPRVAIATSTQVADLDAEGRLLLDRLEELGVGCAPEVWDDPAVPWPDYDCVVVRSTWDYALRRDEYLEWADRVAGVSALLNPPELLRWTTDKHYLRELADAGIPTVPTVFIEPGEAPDHELTGIEHVVKPAVSAGSKDTLRVGAGEGARSIGQVGAILASGRTAIVQPYLAQVDTKGETALVFIDGAFSHAITKAAILEAGADVVAGLFAPEQITPTTASARELDVGARSLAAVPETDTAPLYARVDLLPGDDGVPMVLEVELAEPSLFLDHHPPSVDRLAQAILGRLDR
ncbi:MAG: hypothetical protein R2704_05790 [Microthrixaceae bacterium]